jgi:hypothetical protein
MRTLAMPKMVEQWPLTSLREKLIKIGAKVVSHGRYVTFQLAEVAVSRQIFKHILMLIARLRAAGARMRAGGVECDRPRQRGEKCALTKQEQRVPTPPTGNPPLRPPPTPVCSNLVATAPEEADNRAYGPVTLGNVGSND